MILISITSLMNFQYGNCFGVELLQNKKIRETIYNEIN